MRRRQLRTLGRKSLDRNVKKRGVSCGDGTRFTSALYVQAQPSPTARLRLVVRRRLGNAIAAECVNKSMAVPNG